MQRVSLVINGKKVSREIEDRTLLTSLLRDILSLVEGPQQRKEAAAPEDRGSGDHRRGRKRLRPGYPGA